MQADGDASSVLIAAANRYGLFDDLDKAMACETFINAALTEPAPINVFYSGHVPWVAAGVWIKHWTEKQILVAL